MYRQNDRLISGRTQSSRGTSRTAAAASASSSRAASPDLSKVPDDICSDAADQLRAIDEAIAALSGKRRPNPCHCAGRQHALSSFTPLCTTCALAICTLNSPTHPCPSCGSALLSSSAAGPLLETQRSLRAALIATETERIQAERDEQARQRARETFPTLSTPTAAARTQAPTSHKVVTIGRGGRVTATTYRSQSPKPRTPVEVTANDEAPANRQARKDAVREAQRGWIDPYEAATPTSAFDRLPDRPFAHVNEALRLTYVPTA